VRAAESDVLGPAGVVAEHLVRVRVRVRVSARVRVSVSVNVSVSVRVGVRVRVRVRVRVSVVAEHLPVHMAHRCLEGRQVTRARVETVHRVLDEL